MTAVGVTNDVIGLTVAGIVCLVIGFLSILCAQCGKNQPAKVARREQAAADVVPSYTSVVNTITQTPANQLNTLGEVPPYASVVTSAINIQTNDQTVNYTQNYYSTAPSNQSSSTNHHLSSSILPYMSTSSHNLENNALEPPPPSYESVMQMESQTRHID